MNHSTDFAAIGLDFHSPFDILRRPSCAPVECKIPGKRGPKPGQSKSIVLKGTRLFTDEELIRRKAMRVNRPSTLGTAAQNKDQTVRTKQIQGASNYFRSA